MINSENIKEVTKNLLQICNGNIDEKTYKKLLGTSVSIFLTEEDIRKNYSKAEIEQRLVKIIDNTRQLNPKPQLQLFKLALNKVLIDLNQGLNDEISDWLFIVPIDNLAIENEIKIGKVTLGNFTGDIQQKVVDYYQELLRKRSKTPEEKIEEINAIIKPFVGKVCAQIIIKGRLEKAHDLALDDITKALSAIKLFGGVIDDDFGRYFGIPGEVASKTRAIMRYEVNGKSANPIYESVGALVPFTIDEHHLEVMKKCRFDIIDALFAKTAHNELETRILSSIYWYGKAFDVQLSRGKITRAENEKRDEKDFDKMKEADRLLKLIITLESLLIFNEKEALGSNVAERTAVILARNKNEYIAIKKFMHKIYSLRSDVVHHGTINFSLSEMYELQFITRDAILALIMEKDNWNIQNENDFIYWLEKNKLEYEFGKNA